MSKTRNIFEDVGTEAPRDRPLVQPGAIDRAARRGARGVVRLWLGAIFLALAAMVIGAALARLMGQGVILRGWLPLYAMLPPMDGAEWLTAFDRYRAGLPPEAPPAIADLAAFQQAFWWEWGVRQAGTVAAAFWALGLMGLSLPRMMPKGWPLRLFGLGVLMALIGLADWGLGPAGQVPAPYDADALRVASVTGLGYATLALITWYILKLGRSEAQLMQARRAREGAAFGLATAVMHLAVLQIVFGAMLAGLDAGRSFTDWPWMAGQVLPPDPLGLNPVWRNLFDNPGLVQFIHRTLGYLMVLIGLAAWLKGRRSVHARTRRAFHGLAAMLVVQVALGVGTVLYAAQWHIAITHNVGAVVLVVLILRARFLAQYPIQKSIRG